jgi:hypothetical protein
MRDVILVMSVIGGATAAIAGPLLALLLSAVGLLGRDRLQEPVAGPDAVAGSIALGIAAAGLGLGLPLARAGWRALQGRPGRPLRLPHWWIWLLLFLGVLLVGQAASISDRAPGLMPFLQIAAGGLPAFLFLAFALDAAGSRSDLGRRPATGSLSWGGLGGAGLALAGEILLVGAAVVGTIIFLGITDPEMVARLQATLIRIGQSGQGLTPSDLAPLSSSPAIALVVLAFLGVLAPALEEFTKGLAVPLVAGAGRRLTRLDGFLYGVAAGAGFALVEGLLNGALALRSEGAWAGLMVARGAAAAMHCLASGLAGLGWQAILSDRRWLRGIGLGLLAVALHSAWNASVGVIGLNSLQAAGTGRLGDMARLGLTSLLVLFMGALWLAVVVGLALIPRRLKRDVAEPEPI